MNTKHILTATILLATSFLVYSCSGDGDKKETTEAPASMVEEAPEVSDKGIGKFQDVELTNPLDEGMIAEGKTVYEVKCASCHKLSSEKLVGPGWEDVTERRTPEWIMNFITNVDEMLEKDPESQAMLEICMVRMPNQNLSDEEARNVLEFMRYNDQQQQ
ncbi:MAG TPA: cytochrome c [Flavipsychrobacter sp.]